MKRSNRFRERRGAVAVEAGMVLPMLIIVMFGVWEVGRMIQVNQVLINGAREGARLAAGGYVDGTPVTNAMVTQAVRDYLRAAQFPADAYNGAQVTLTCLATPNWTNPSDALPNDSFSVQVTIPAGAPFDSLAWSLVTRYTGVTSMTTTVGWMSLNDEKIVVDTQLPF
jgi:Flp pilus assembly protein TadG